MTKNNQFKLTLPQIIYITAILITFLFRWESCALSFNMILDYQIWKLLTSILYVPNYVSLATKIITFIYLSFLLEQKKGSVVFVFDIFFKHLTIVCLSSAFYIFFYLGGKVFENWMRDVSEY